ncbi:hypothetical protein S40285_09806 [Stachybotrys chlorohalonatus IBT 40285]|uniref:Uncharacterized protein n=1 Tax=Stachybotrys chlorohalonatus (strain IBT 40285) TaxID=1283841 RepID=A0A084QZ57_STAC4|nr:hypothetical protein S40285_09806 [Stachybotrys chlorohalonata IBT 40285]
MEDIFASKSEGLDLDAIGRSSVLRRPMPHPKDRNRQHIEGFNDSNIFANDAKLVEKDAGHYLAGVIATEGVAKLDEIVP